MNPIGAVPVPHPPFTPPNFELREALRASLAPTDALLLSGGIDSSLLAALDPGTPALTIGLIDASDDLTAAEVVARALGLHWQPVRLSRVEALECLAELVVVLHSYNLELLNDIPLYVGARTVGAGGLRTGEFADELFRGYTYLYDYPDDLFVAQVEPRSRRYCPPSAPIFGGLGATGGYPYLSPEVVRYGAGYARGDNVIDAVCTRDGDYHTARRGGPPGPRLRRWGKAMLRRAGAGLLPDEIVGRPKQDLMYGSGMVALTEDLARLVPPGHIHELAAAGVWLVPDERAAHAGLYTLFRDAGLTPRPPAGPDEAACLGCGGAVRVAEGNHCRTCGRYPATVP